MVKAFELLMKDHREVENLFKRCEQTEDQQERAKLVKQILHHLAVHAQLEEKYFYPIALKNAELKEKILESINEHHAAELTMSELARMQPGEQCTAKAKVLQEMIEHHVKEEETTLFPRCREVLDARTLDRVAQDIEANKPDLMSKGLNVLITMIREEVEREPGGEKAGTVAGERQV